MASAFAEVDPMRPPVLCAVLAVPLLIFSLRAQAGADCYRIAMLAEAPNIDLDKALGELLYREAGLCATLVRVPTERLKRMLEKDQIDAVVVRSLDFIRAQPGMVAVPTPLLTVEGRLYWRLSGVKPEGAGRRIGFSRGGVWQRVEVEKLGAEPVEVDNVYSLMKMAETDRIDGFAMTDTEFEKLVAAPAERQMFTSAFLRPIPLYHAVTGAHADLVPRLDAAIQRLVARGEIRGAVEHPGL